MSRKRTRRKVYDLVNPITHAIMGAAITDTASLDKLRLRELSAIESFRMGAATREDWKTCADFLNIEETLCREGVGADMLEQCMKAQEALGAAHDRFKARGKLGVSGPELQALREAWADHDAQRTNISRSRYEQAIRKTAARIRSALASHKICV